MDVEVHVVMNHALHVDVHATVFPTLGALECTDWKGACTTIEPIVENSGSQIFVTTGCIHITKQPQIGVLDTQASMSRSENLVQDQDPDELSTKPSCSVWMDIKLDPLKRRE
jgi:hypothetical protein